MRSACYVTGSVLGALVPARQDRAWMDAFTDRHAYRCLPLAIGITFGWQVLSPCTVEIGYSGGDQQEDIRLSGPDGASILEHVAKSNFSCGILSSTPAIRSAPMPTGSSRRRDPSTSPRTASRR
jgi:hypothetical protein